MRNLRHTAFAATVALAAFGLAGPLQAQQPGSGMMGGDRNQAQAPDKDKAQTQTPAQDQNKDQTQDRNENQDERRYGTGYRHGYGPRNDRGYGTMGQGYGPEMMEGYRRGYGRGMMNGYGPGYHGRQSGQGNYSGRVTVNLSANDVKSYFDRLIAAEGNPHLKVGEVKEKDADTIVADIVTRDNSLVQRFAVNRQTGYYKPEEE